MPGGSAGNYQLKVASADVQVADGVLRMVAPQPMPSVGRPGRRLRTSVRLGLVVLTLCFACGCGSTTEKVPAAEDSTLPTVDAELVPYGLSGQSRAHNGKWPRHPAHPERHASR